MASSLDFVPVDIDMADDPKVFALMEELGGDDECARWASYGRLLALMQRIYHEGFYLVYGRFERRKMARDLGMTGEELDSFIESCISCEIFDEGAYRQLSALTSRGIQRRYFKAKKTGKASVSDEDAPYVLIELQPAQSQSAPRNAGNRRESPRSSENRREAPKKAKNAPRIAEPSEEKIREEKISKEKIREASARSARRSSSDSDLPSLRSLAATAYPLACMSTVADPHGGYMDDAGEAYDTPWDALVSTHAHKTGGQPIDGFARQVAKLCPKGCDCSLERVEECARMIRRGLDKFDPSKGANPYPLVAKIIRDERGDAR